MITVQSFRNSIDKLILDPKFQEPLMLVKTIRNGLVYGFRIRFPHALVLVFLFGSGTTREKISKVVKLTRQHAMCLANFAFLYKLICIALKRANRGKEGRAHTAIAGLLSGYWVLGRDEVSSSSVVQQMVMYAMSRVLMGLARLSVQTPGEKSSITDGHGHGHLRQVLLRAGWPVSTSLCWAAVMWLHRWHPGVLQPTLQSSLTYIYDDAEQWNGFTTLLLRNR